MSLNIPIAFTLLVVTLGAIYGFAIPFDSH